ncbi:uncharacterized protein LOC117126547 [Brassica rapa]|uniref:uncharacterized protein LOC117126547 n=1 Tax=Brassica campestris TaxID=3711 RepID=UPI00142DCD3D|nr:uncharacterized protein LOC117126547 [Brassica rapa]
MDEVKAKLGSVHKLLKKQVCLADDADAVDTEDNKEVEEDVNFISGTGFQKSGNQSGNMNFYGNGQMSNLNQSLQYQKPYSNYSNNYNNIKSYENSSYQNPPPQTQESKIEPMLDQVLERQQKLTMDFNGKIDSVYNNSNTKFDTLNIHVQKLEM